MQRLPIPRLRGTRARGAARTTMAAGSRLASLGPTSVDETLAFGPREIDRLARAVARRLGEPRRRIDSPDEIRRALADALGDRLGSGSIGVVRLPAALQTPESWHVTLTGVSSEARDEMERMAEEARDG